MSNWKILMPVAAQNLCLNPSAEIATPANYSSVDGSTVTRDTTYARFGDYCYKIVPGGTERGISLTTAAMANAIHYVTFYVKGVTGALDVSLDAGAHHLANIASIIGGSTGGWVRYGFAVSASEANIALASISNHAIKGLVVCDLADCRASDCVLHKVHFALADSVPGAVAWAD